MQKRFGTLFEEKAPGRGHFVVILGKILTLTVPLSTKVYKWVTANLINVAGNPARD